MMAVARDKKNPGEVNQKGETLQLKSEWGRGGGYVAPGGNPDPQFDTGFPRPFRELNQYQTPEEASMSTGYYFVDSDTREVRNTEYRWKPDVVPVDTTFEPKLWTKIVSGPRGLDKEYWYSPLNTNGKYFFRNPANILEGDIFDPDTDDLDSTDNAIAGPIPIGIAGGFYYNGLRYDSFYVSTNGVIALTNRRYVYSGSSVGTKAIPTGSDHCYDPHSMDWFVGGDVADVSDYPQKTRKRASINPANPEELIYYGDADGDGATDITGLYDDVPDNFGYQYSVLGDDPHREYTDPVDWPMFTENAGIRSNGCGNNLTTYVGGANYGSEDCKPTVIAPFWGPLQMSQYNKNSQKNDQFASCYFKREIANDKLTISYFNLTFNGNLANVPRGNISFPKDGRNDDLTNMWFSAQIVLDRQDSSITMIFFDYGTGRHASTGAATGDIIRANTTSGLFGWAREVNYDAHDKDAQVKFGDYNYPWNSEYKQYTHYFSKNVAQPDQYPFSSSAVKYKQWRNTLRVANISYLVRDTDPSNIESNKPSYDFSVEVPSTDYEVLAGAPFIDAIQPRALIQNLTNDVQGRRGVNFVEQDFEFWARFKIKNLVTGDFIYNRAVPVSKQCLSLDETNWDSCSNNSPYIRVRLCDDVQQDQNLGYIVNDVFDGDEFDVAKYDGIPPYRFVRVDFDPFVPNEFMDSHIGRMKAFVIAEPKNIKNRETIGDQWPFDDTTETRFFVMKRLDNFIDDVTEFHQDIETKVLYPSVLKWVTIEADVLQGEGIALHPLPPRGTFYASMPGVDEVDTDAASVTDPIIGLNRLLGTQDNHPPTNTMTEWGANGLRGDQIRSYPIDLRGKYGAVLSVGVQRGQRVDNKNYFQNYTRDWGESTQPGPEGRTFVNGSAFKVPAPIGPGHDIMVPGTATCADMLVVEFAKPSDDGVNNICNIEDKNWRHLPYRRGTDLAALTDMAPLSIYGSGGYLRGFLESDPDSTLTWPDHDLQLYNALRPDVFDTGHDWDFQKYSVGIPDTFINWKNQGARNFRFRVRVLADNHQISTNPQSEPDDADWFFIDNVAILFPDEVTDLEMNSVRIQMPYHTAPASQTTNVPVYVKVSNGTARPASNFGIKVKIYKEGDFDSETMLPRDPSINPIYCRMETIQNLSGGEFIEHTMPNWDARKHMDPALPKNKFTLVSYVVSQNGDLVPSNDTTYFNIELNTAPFFAYDPVIIDDEGKLSGMGNGAGQAGLATPGSNYNGAHNNTGEGAIANTIPVDLELGQGYDKTESFSGKIATKFKLSNTDYFTGYMAYLGSFNSGPDVIEFMLYKGNDQEPSSEVVPNSRLVTHRGENNGEFVYDAAITYMLDEPIELAPDTYWVSISQLTAEPLCLGASPARTRMKVTNFYESLDLVNGEKAWGEKGNHIYLDRNLRRNMNNNWVNDNYAAYLNIIPNNIQDEEGDWVQFTPTQGKIAYPHSTHKGYPRDYLEITPLYMNSSWFPTLYPLFTTYFSQIAGQELDSWENCADDTIAVELLTFKADKNSDGIVLRWETASETNNAGFEVQRRVYGEGAWNKIAFIEGAGNSKTHKYYNYNDTEVTPNTVYEYQLRDLDSDGMVACATSEILLVKYEIEGAYELEQNTPNPVENMTNIGFKIAENAKVKIEIINMLGNVVAELTNTNYAAGNHVISWNCYDQNGTKVPAGSYLYRMIVNDKVITKKMTIIR
jgi:hypothetical protein